MKVFSLLAAVLFGLAANAETKEIIWDSSTIQSISLGRSFFENEDSASIVTAKDGIYLKIEVLSGTMIDFYGRGIYTNGKVFFTPSEGKLTQVVFNASKEKNLDGWTTRGTQLVWTGNADRAYINNSTSSVSVEGIQSISFMVEVEEKTDTISPSAGVEVNEVNFPDASFRRWIQGQSYGSDLMLTDEEIALVKSINVMDKSITSLKGIEFFTALTELQCQHNRLTSLDVSKNTALTSLYTPDNQLTSLNVTGCTALTALTCTGNRLASLNVTGCTALKTLNCYSNQIKGTAMDSLIMSLPAVSGGKILVIYNRDEANVMTTTQVAAAKTKGWIPQWLDPSYGWAEYAGSEPEAPKYSISGIPAGWQVNGQTVSADSIGTATVSFPEGTRVIFSPANIPAGKKIKSIKVVKK